MNVVGLMRVKNEAPWIERSIRSIAGLCGEVIVFDDHSTDGTPQIAQAAGASVIDSPFEGCDESRDKNFLLDLVRGNDVDWVVMIDGDEELAPGGDKWIRGAMLKPSVRSISMDVLYLWDAPDRVRCDGVYGEFLRQSVFRPGREARFPGGAPRVFRQGPPVRFTEGAPPNFHCGNVPASIRFPYYRSPAQLLHYGYMEKETRLRKHAWYNAVDPGNKAEDEYRHLVIGDLVPADTKAKHGGPLRLRPLSEVLR